MSKDQQQLPTITELKGINFFEKVGETINECKKEDNEKVVNKFKDISHNVQEESPPTSQSKKESSNFIATLSYDISLYRSIIHHSGLGLSKRNQIFRRKNAEKL